MSIRSLTDPEPFVFQPVIVKRVGLEDLTHQVNLDPDGTNIQSGTNSYVFSDTFGSPSIIANGSPYIPPLPANINCTNLTATGSVSAGSLNCSGLSTLDDINANDVTVGGVLTATSAVSQFSSIATGNLACAGSASFNTGIFFGGLATSNGIVNTGDVSSDTLTVTTSGTVGGSDIVTLGATQTLLAKTLNCTTGGPDRDIILVQGYDLSNDLLDQPVKTASSPTFALVKAPIFNNPGGSLTLQSSTINRLVIGTIPSSASSNLLVINGTALEQRTVASLFPELFVTGSTALTWQGLTAAPSCTLYYQVTGNIVNVRITGFTGTKLLNGSLTLLAGSIPLAARPLATSSFIVSVQITSTPSFSGGTLILNTDGSAELYASITKSTFTDTQTVGLHNDANISFVI